MSPVDPKPHRSPPSRECAHWPDYGLPQQYHRCYFDSRPDDPYDPFNRSDLWDQPGAPEENEGVFGASYGFSYGFVLWRYLLDWGDTVGAVTMKQGLVTALKGWPLLVDRQAAAACLFRFVRKGDTCQPDLTMQLIRHPAYVGFTWHPSTLKTWLAAVEPDPQCKYRAQFPDGSATGFATDWLNRAHRYWVLLTAEPFPYDLANVVSFWRDRELSAPPLPANRQLAAGLVGQAPGNGPCGDCGLA